MPAMMDWAGQTGSMADDYQMLEELGSGSFGVVYRAIERATGEYVAIKHIDLEGSDDDIREIQQEISLLSTCSSQYVTRYKASFVRGVKLWIVMEYLGGGSCLDLLRPGPMAEGYIAVIMRELLEGLDYLHSTGKIHRDIKAANILLSDSGQVKIADFGVAAQLTNIKSQRMTFVGTPFWMAPEVIQEAGYDYHADIWSLGITAMELALGEPPRSDIHPMKVLFLIPKEKAPRLEGNKWSRDFKDFVALCLNKDPDKRPTAHALLKHTFIRRAGRTDMLQDLVLKARKFEQNADRRERDTRYYEETLREMSIVEDEDDEWVFDTIKTAGSMRPPPQPKQTVKRRRLERIPSGHAADMTDATLAMEDMTLDAAPLGDAVVTPSKDMSTIRTPKPKMGTQRRISASSVRRMSSQAVTARKVSTQNPDAVLDVAQQMVAPKQRQPLGLDMSFGNSPSTVRQFRRVSSGGRQNGAQEQCTSPQDSVFDSDEENKAPTAPISMPLPAVIATKESMLGRRCYAKCIDPAFQEAHAATADRHKRDVLARVGEAWSALDELDPEGELLLLKAVISRVQADPKLASKLMPQHLASTQLASLRMSPSKKTSLVTATEIGSRDVSPQSSPTKTRRASELPSNLAKRQSSPTKLVFNPQNPHLKKMRSSQQLKEQQLKEKAALEAKMPGNTQAGLEHVSMLSNVLYNRWTDGLRSRWPLA